MVNPSVTPLCSTSGGVHKAANSLEIGSKVKLAQLHLPVRSTDPGMQSC